MGWPVNEDAALDHDTDSSSYTVYKKGAFENSVHGTSYLSVRFSLGGIGTFVDEFEQVALGKTVLVIILDQRVWVQNNSRE